MQQVSTNGGVYYICETWVIIQPSGSCADIKCWACDTLNGSMCGTVCRTGPRSWLGYEYKLHTIFLLARRPFLGFPILLSFLRHYRSPHPTPSQNCLLPSYLVLYSMGALPHCSSAGRHRARLHWHPQYRISPLFKYDTSGRVATDLTRVAPLLQVGEISSYPPGAFQFLPNFTLSPEQHCTAQLNLRSGFTCRVHSFQLQRDCTVSRRHSQS